jgi:diguanylate cyclase (GGDEF)-like protein
MMLPALAESVLAWERALLSARSLGEWLGVAADPPGSSREDRAISLLVADATFELRHLAAGNHATTELALPVTFVDSLVSVAPQLESPCESWHGEFHAADHALLMPGKHGLQHLLMLPLRRGEHLVGVWSLATSGSPPELAGAGERMLAHAGAVLAASIERLFDHARLLRGGLIDTLTGWNSGRYLYTRLREEIARSQRRGSSTACLVVDIDRLHAVNEELGQPAGDRVLREIAHRIESQVRSCDTAARIGSDQFVVLMPETGAAQGTPLAARILAAMRAAPVDLGGGLARRVSVSIGIAATRPPARGDRKTLADRLVADAVATMHRVKQKGGDGYEVAGP